jgi:dethiobiotin synthetase
MPTPPALRSFVVLGADAGDGQTLVASALVQALCGQGVKAVAMKAAPHGDELQRLAAASAFGLPPRVLCPPPGAPTLDAVVDTFRVLATWADAVVLDGADPAGPEGADVARALGLPFVFVVGLRPGCAAAAVHKAQALARSGLECAGWVLNRSTPGDDAQVDALRVGLPGPWLGSIPHLQRVAAEPAARAIDMPRTLAALALPVT